MNETDRLYAFVFRGELAKEALAKTGFVRGEQSAFLEAETANDLSISYLDQALLTSAKRMAAVYAAVATFENSARRLVQTVLLDAKKDNWWDECVSKNIRDRAESRQNEEKKIKWHTQRGQDLINYTELRDLSNVIQNSNNWPFFEPHVRSAEWVRSIFDVIERSRNVIMHSGTLEREDIQRIGINIRDWIKQVGA